MRGSNDYTSGEARIDNFSKERAAFLLKRKKGTGENRYL